MEKNDNKNLLKDSGLIGTEELGTLINDLARINKRLNVEKTINGKVTDQSADTFDGTVTSEIAMKSLELTNYGKYILASIRTSMDEDDLSCAHEDIHAVFNSFGECLHKFSTNISFVHPVDEENFLVIPKSKHEKIKHYHINDYSLGIESEMIEKAQWDNNSDFYFKTNSEMKNNNIMIISENGRQVLYSIKTSQTRGFSYTTIDPFLNGCVVTLTINSELKSVGHGPETTNIEASQTLVGMIRYDGILIHNLYDMETGEKYPITNDRQDQYAQIAGLEAKRQAAVNESGMNHLGAYIKRQKVKQKGTVVCNGIFSSLDI